MISNKTSILSNAANVRPYVQTARVQPSTQDLVARQTVVDITSLNRGNDAITPVNAGKIINFMPIPETITILVHNTNGAGATVKLFNNSDFTAIPGGVNVTYSDGFSGKLLNKLINGLQNAAGMLIYGFNVTGYDSEGVKSDAVLNALQLAALYYTGNGDESIPAQVSIAGAERNTQFKDGLLTIKTLIVFNFLSQFKMYLGAGEKAQFVLNLQPLQD